MFRNVCFPLSLAHSMSSSACRHRTPSSAMQTSQFYSDFSSWTSVYFNECKAVFNLYKRWSLVWGYEERRFVKSL